MVRDLTPLPAPPQGAYPNVDEFTYHRWEGLSSHRLGDIADGKTPERLRWEMDHPTPPTPDKKKGTMVHAAILQPHRLSEVAVPGLTVTRHSAKNKAAWAAHEAKHADKVILPVKDWDECTRQVEQALKHRKLRALLELEGFSEYPIVWHDTENGVAWKALIDRWIPGINTILDLKTTVQITYEDFRRDSEKFGYHRQAAHYIDTAQRMGLPAERFVIAALEKKAPYFLHLREMPSDLIEMGRAELQTARTMLTRCYQKNEWPGYDEDIMMMEPSHWMWRKHADLFS